MPANKRGSIFSVLMRTLVKKVGAGGDQMASLLKKAAGLLLFHEPEGKERFVLIGTDESKDTFINTQESNKNPGEENNKKQERRALKKPKRTRRVSSAERYKEDGQQDPLDLSVLMVDFDIDMNKHYIEEIYSLPKNKDIILREFIISLPMPIRAFAVFIDGLTERKTINEVILKPLMILSKLDDEVDVLNLAEYIKDRILFSDQARVTEKFSEILETINYGGTAVFIDGSPKCLLVETKGWDKRSIGQPETEKVIRGPHEAFNETLRSNTALIRKAIRNNNLITEIMKIGERNKTDVAIMYLEDVASPNLVEEVKRRISSIKSDYVGDTGILEQLIEDHPFTIAPQALSTERPDRVASFIIDGKVAILMDGSPFALIVPTTFYSLLHTPEDYYLRLPYGNIIRVLRMLASLIALVTPAIYISISNYHQEMIPTELILSIAANREAVPFPSILEIIIMEFSFELIREAGVRVPGVIGNTLGIVGALILGQAAVEAGIVSPIMIIVVAVTGLASFAIPNIAMSFSIRGIRFLFTALAAIFGFIGISAGLFLTLTSLAGIKSFGVPLLSPLGPRTKNDPDVVLRGPVWSMEVRPDYTEALERQKQPEISRGWTKKNRKRAGKRQDYV